MVTTIASMRCAVPVACVVETMRTRSTDGETTRHRGDELRVIDAAALVGVTTMPQRAVVLRAGAERVALLVNEVLDVRTVRADQLGKRVFPTVDLALGPALVAVLGEVRLLVGDET